MAHDTTARSFGAELMEVLADAGSDFNSTVGQMTGVGERFFNNLAGRSAGITSSELATTLVLVFMAGRLHAGRGYVSPMEPDETVSDQLDAALRRIQEEGDPSA